VPGQEALTALTQERRALSAVLEQLGAEDFERATNCPPWDLAELVVHIAMSIRVGDEPPIAAPGGALSTAADYYRRAERNTSPYRQGNVERTRQVAAAVLATTSAAQWFGETCATTINALRRRDLGQVIPISGVGPMRLADWVTTRVMSLAAHGLDVAITLGRPPWTTRSALIETAPVLTDLLCMPPPAELGWDDLALLAVGTGRRPLTEDERSILGPAQRRFPLLS
jgi:uncharacterized protein (TIGR03083 family)